VQADTMAKGQAAKKKASTAAQTPPPLFPVVVRVPEDDFTFSEVEYTELENAGGFSLSSELRSRLLNLAVFWIEDLRIRLSPRPKAFRECLEKIIDTLSDAEEASRWDDPVRRHLLHWAMATDVEGAEALPGRLYGLEDNLKSAREFFTALIQKLPPDPGRQRPFNDERRIIALADVFEAAGGKPIVYASGYYEEGSMADTPFRRFAQLFYFLLPADDKRDRGGLDDALRDALAVRREMRSP
jgi:hypothetical protein